jgi:hypothetical protein
VKTLGVIYYYMKILKRRQLFEKININNIGYNKELKCRQLQNKDCSTEFSTYEAINMMCNMVT